MAKSSFQLSGALCYYVPVEGTAENTQDVRED